MGELKSALVVCDKVGGPLDGEGGARKLRRPLPEMVSVTAVAHGLVLSTLARAVVDRRLELAHQVNRFKEIHFTRPATTTGRNRTGGRGQTS